MKRLLCQRLRRPGFRELYLIRQRLNRYPAALQAIAFAASELHRPTDTLNIRDVEKRC